MMMNPIILKGDKRFKLGNIKRIGNKLRGNPLTVTPVTLEPYQLTIEQIELMSHEARESYFNTQLRPPIVISSELATQLKGMGF